MSSRRILGLCVLAVAVTGLAVILAMLADPARSGPDDFVIFWAAGRLIGTGGDPYNSAALLALERTASWSQPYAYSMRNPPWILPLLLPTGMLPYRSGRVVWYALQLAMIVLSADLWWKLSKGSPDRRGMTWLLPFALAPTMIVWRTGQVTPFVLLALVLFTAAERRGKNFAAGAALALAAIKPHIVCLLWPAALLWVVARRQWQTAVGFALTLAALLAIVTGLRPTILHDFAAGTSADPPHNPTSTIGTVLRLTVRAFSGVDYFSLVWLAPVVGLVWVLRRWQRRGDTWCWVDELPLIVLVSMACAPFAWIYDEVLAVLALVQIVAIAEHAGRRLPRTLIAGLLAFDVAVLAMNIARVDPFWYVWTAFALLALYAVARRRLAAPDVEASRAGPGLARAT